MIESLYRQNRCGTAMAFSLKDYHTPNLHSIILHRSEGLTIRLQVSFAGETTLADASDDTLKVHNHGFDFSCQTLVGYIENHIYVESSLNERDSLPQHKYEFKSAVHDSGKTHALLPLGRCGLRLVERQVLPAGADYWFEHTGLHKIKVPSDRLVAWLFFEYENQHSSLHRPLIYSQEPLPLSWEMKELYTQPSLEEMDHVVHAVLDQMRCRNDTTEQGKSEMVC